MCKIYKKIGNFNLVQKDGAFGLTNSLGELILPCEYDSIFCESGGFIITKNSKSGYIKFREKIPPHGENETVFGYPEKLAEQYLPCIYDRVEPTVNGLVLYSMTSDPYSSEKRAWFDLRSAKLYENLYFLRNHGRFDEFLDSSKGGQMPHLKHAGENFYVYIPFDLTVHILYEIPLYSEDVHYFLCSEELPENEANKKGYGYEYFFMIVLSDSYTFTAPKLSSEEAFDVFPSVIAFWEKQARAEKEHKEYMKEKSKMASTTQEIYDGGTEDKMNVTIYSRKDIESLLSSGKIENAATISFHDPIGRGRRHLEDYAPIDFSGKCDRVMQIAIHDLDPEALTDFGLTLETYFPEADALAEFIYRAKADGLDIICQCEYGQSRSAGCAAAILQHFESRGIDIFANYKYYPNQLIYNKLFDALERAKMSSDSSTRNK